eukprot:8026717-Pyramimonas_sp.AAC.2
MANEISANLRSMEPHQHPWDMRAAHRVIPGPFGRSRCFYFDTMTVEFILAQNDDALTESEIYQYWDLVEKADQQEARSFIDNNCFMAKHGNDPDNGNINRRGMGSTLEEDVRRGQQPVLHHQIPTLRTWIYGFSET